MMQNTFQKLAVVTTGAALLGLGTICAKSAQASIFCRTLTIHFLRRINAMNSITAFLSKAAVVLIGLATVALPVPALAQATLVADYQFNETLASSIEGAPSLAALGKWNPFVTETVDGQPITVFSFGAAGDPGTGLQLSTAGLVPNDNYSVVVLFNFDIVAGWRKILDSNNRLTD